MEWSEWSAPRTALFQRVKVGRPPAPSGLLLTEAGDNWMTLEWKMPSTVGGAVGSYLLYADGILVGEVPPEILQFKWKGVPHFEKDGEAHTYRITSTALNSRGEGPDSNTLYVQREGGAYADVGRQNRRPLPVKRL